MVPIKRLMLKVRTVWFGPELIFVRLMTKVPQIISVFCAMLINVQMIDPLHFQNTINLESFIGIHCRKINPVGYNMSVQFQISYVIKWITTEIFIFDSTFGATSNKKDATTKNEHFDIWKSILKMLYYIQPQILRKRNKRKRGKAYVERR